VGQVSYINYSAIIEVTFALTSHFQRLQLQICVFSQHARTHTVAAQFSIKQRCLIKHTANICFTFYKPVRQTAQHNAVYFHSLVTNFLQPTKQQQHRTSDVLLALRTSEQ
jgi:hypothetical protein